MNETESAQEPKDENHQIAVSGETTMEATLAKLPGYADVANCVANFNYSAAKEISSFSQTFSYSGRAGQNTSGQHGTSSSFFP